MTMRHIYARIFIPEPHNQIELAMIRETVSRPLIGKMRMQFWRDAIQSIAQNKPMKHPIAIALHEASQKANLSTYHLKRMVDARDEDLDRDSYMTLDSVTQYAESTSSTLMYLLLNLLHQGASDTNTHAASHVGIAHSFTTLLRGLPFHASKRRLIIPVEITAKHQVRQEEVFRMGSDAAGIDDAVFEFATVANDNLLTARDKFKDSGVSAEAMPAFLLAVPVASYLSRLEAVNFNAFVPKLQAKDWKLPFNIWRASHDVLLLIFIQLDDPAALSATSKRFHAISKESYTRALYFVTRYGHQHAMYWALGRGKLVDKQTLDDPLVLDFPLALSYEPRLLPLAVANGFRIDVKYRDFIFRKVFEKPAVVREGRDDNIIKMVGDLQRLDPIRTVAAEVCMEAKINEQGYTALRRLDASRKLPYSLSSLVSALIKLFSNTRSVTFPKTISLIQSLHMDFPNHSDPKIRHVLLLTVFCSPTNMQWSDEAHSTLMPKLLDKLVELHLIRDTSSTGGLSSTSKVREHGHEQPPKMLSRDELVEVLLSPFTENERSCIAYARDPLGMDLKEWEVVQLKGDVAVRCLPISSKGKMLKRLCEDKRIERRVAEAMKQHAIRLEDLPDSFAPECATYRANLGASLPVIGMDLYGFVPLWATHTEEDESETEVKTEDDKNTSGLSGSSVQKSIFTTANCNLGTISQDTLTARLDRDESGTRWNRRRWWSHNHGIHSMPSELEAKLPYPASPRHVAEHILEHFKSHSRPTAIMMTHCALGQYIDENVPITLFHFKVLARLGRQPCWKFWHKVESQAFYFSEDDYLPRESTKPPSSGKMSINTLCNPDPIKPERQTTPGTPLGSEEGFLLSGRPRRMAASATRSYKIPTESDEETVDEMDFSPALRRVKGKGKGKAVERTPPVQSESTSLHLWTKHLGLLLKEEEKKWKERKRLAERDEFGRPKERIFKTEFMRSLASRIASFRERDRASTPVPVVEDDSDEEYVQRPAAKTKRKLQHTRWSDREDRTPFKRFKTGTD
ncbi:hypothetical protein FRC07_000614 [Ceratobasidium sp. 392]|nr:hypothetical protein FRC07_000614 [Ceratobasidium sp. 392]